MRHLTVLLLLLCACAPNPVAPVRVVALVSEAPGSYGTREVELKTIKDLVGMKGDVATFVGGARIVLEDAPGLTDEQYAKYITRNPGGDVHVNFIEKDGLFWPSDFDSWNLVSSYYNLEKAHEYFVGAGVPGPELTTSTVYYLPDFENPPGTTKFDAAAWLHPLQGFVLTAFKDYQEVPFPMNANVIAHEFAHKVWNRRVYAGAGQPEVITRWSAAGANGGLNVLTAFDEGVADYHAYGASCLSLAGCDPRFLAASLPDEYSSARDLSLPNRCLTNADRDAIYSTSTLAFTSGSQYKVGTAIASALYQAGEKTGKRQDLQRALLAAYSDDDPTRQGIKQLVALHLESPAQFKLEVVIDSILGHIADVQILRKEVCNQMWGRLKLDTALLQSCPPASVPTQDCAGVP